MCSLLIGQHVQKNPEIILHSSVYIMGAPVWPFDEFQNLSHRYWIKYSYELQKLWRKMATDTSLMCGNHLPLINCVFCILQYVGAELKVSVYVPVYPSLTPFLFYSRVRTNMHLENGRCHLIKKTEYSNPSNNKPCNLWHDLPIGTDRTQRHIWTIILVILLPECLPNA